MSHPEDPVPLNPLLSDIDVTQTAVQLHACDQGQTHCQGIPPGWLRARSITGSVARDSCGSTATIRPQASAGRRAGEERPVLREHRPGSRCRRLAVERRLLGRLIQLLLATALLVAMFFDSLRGAAGGRQPRWQAGARRCGREAARRTDRASSASCPPPSKGVVLRSEEEPPSALGKPLSRERDRVGERHGSAGWSRLVGTARTSRRP
jgi:hypothetical protein